MSETEGTTQRRCQNCGEWYDARSYSCYLCGDEQREYNHHLKKAVETAALNGALSSQMGVAAQEARAEQVLTAARNSGDSESFARARPGTRGYGTLVEGIRNSLENNPSALDFFGGKD